MLGQSWRMIGSFLCDKWVDENRRTKYDRISDRQWGWEINKRISSELGLEHVPITNPCTRWGPISQHGSFFACGFIIDVIATVSLAFCVFQTISPYQYSPSLCAITSRIDLYMPFFSGRSRSINAFLSQSVRCWFAKCLCETSRKLRHRQLGSAVSCPQ